MAKAALAVMYRDPVPGSVKTRLTPRLTEQEAAGLYREFLADIFDKTALLKGVDIFGARAPGGRGGGGFVLPEGVREIAQEGADLGERMLNVFRHLFKAGYGKVSLIGSDSPDLPIRIIEGAFRAMDGPETVVLGPAKDGGYYLIGMARACAAIFDGIRWSTETVLRETLEKAGQEGLKVALLELWHDFDNVDDLRHLKDSVEAPKSAEFLRNMRFFG